MTVILKQVLTFLPFAALVVLAAASGSLFQPGAWYAALDKPSWTPPNWAFPVVWTTLYVFIAVAGWLVWQAEGLRLALTIWGIQLILNAAWSWIMFSRHQIGWALVDAVAMWVAVLAFIIIAWPVSRWASLLFVPYLTWVSAAIALNWSVLVRNPGA